MTKLLLTAVLLLVSCNDDCPRAFAQNITSYGYSPNKTTPAGYRIDANKTGVDLASIDCIINAVTECFLDVPEYEPPDPECLKITIAPDWFHPVGPEGDEIESVQIFNCDLGCVQGCMGAIQDNQKIIVTPDLAALAHELIHVQTGVRDPIPEVWYQCESIHAGDCK